MSHLAFRSSSGLQPAVEGQQYQWALSPEPFARQPELAFFITL